MAPAAQASGAAAKKFTTAVSKPFSMASRPGTKQQSKAPVSAAATTTPFKPAASNPTPKPIANPSKPPTTTATTTNPPTRLQTTKSLPKPPTSTLLKPATPVKPAPNPTTKPPSIFKTSSQPHDLPNWISRSIQSYVQLAGDYAGNTITALGDRVNKMGEAVGGKITDTTRGWGQGVSGYGNEMKDSVGVGGSRVATAGNPIGLQGMGAGRAGRAGDDAGKAAKGKGKGSAGNPLGLS